jgi:hypothetical protein
MVVVSKLVRLETLLEKLRGSPADRAEFLAVSDAIYRLRVWEGF